MSHTQQNHIVVFASTTRAFRALVAQTVAIIGCPAAYSLAA